MGVNKGECHKALGAAEGTKGDKASWGSFFQWLCDCSLDGVKLVVGNKCLGMLEAVGEVFPAAKYQRCTVPLLLQCVPSYASPHGETSS